jgi:hypothetical protein
MEKDSSRTNTIGLNKKSAGKSMNLNILIKLTC